MHTHYVPSSLLSIDTNPKTVKGQRYGFKTAVLYMAPYTLSGANLCPMAHIALCHGPCLNTAGNPAYAATKAKGRLNKAHYFLADPRQFMNQLVREVYRFVVRAVHEGFIPLVRLNGTTDIRWERVTVRLDERTARILGVDPGVYPNIMALFPGVQFYDYTKITNRTGIPDNYDLTFSYSGVPAFQPYVDRARRAGMRIAVVFQSRHDIPETFMGMRCVDGDDSDLRHLDPQGVVVALYAKGRAKTDTSGFVVRRVIPIGIAA
jgi:hypothetical protein